MIVYLELRQQLAAFDDQMIRGDQVNQHLESNQVDGTDLFLRLLFIYLVVKHQILVFVLWHHT